MALRREPFYGWQDQQQYRKVELGLIRQATAAALIAAGLLSVVIFPLVALTMLRRAEVGSKQVVANEQE